MFEDFTASGAPSVSFQLFDQVRPSRYWFSSQDLTRLVQVQPDRFTYNWRDENDAAYPRYRALRTEFDGLFGSFIETCADRSPVPTWCEVTYINPIDVRDLNSWPDLSQLLRRFAATDVCGLGTPETTRFSESYLLQRSGSAYGRFHVTAEPAVRFADGAHLFVLNLVARGMPATPDKEGVMAFLDEGHRLIVNGFRDMTTDAMHAVWGLDESR